MFGYHSKKVVSVVAALMLIVVACGGDAASDTSTNVQAETSTTFPTTVPERTTTTDLTSLAAGPPGGCIEFEDVFLATIFAVGDIFASNGHELLVEDFDWLPSGSTTSGIAEIQDQGLAGGSGQDYWTNNTRVRWRYDPPAAHVAMRFGEYGGNVNLQINGDSANVEDFVDITATTLGGVVVNASGPGASGQGTGSIELEGTVQDLAIGGQEFVLDDVCSTE